MLGFVLPATSWHTTTTASPHALISSSYQRESAAVAATYEAQQPPASTMTPSNSKRCARSSVSTTHERLVSLRHHPRRRTLLELSPGRRTGRRRPRVCMGISGLSDQHNEHDHVSREGNVDPFPQVVASNERMEKGYISAAVSGTDQRRLFTASARARQDQFGLVVRLKRLRRLLKWGQAIRLFHTIKKEQSVVLNNAIYRYWTCPEPSLSVEYQHVSHTNQC